MTFSVRIKFRMNLHHVLFFCFFSALCGGNSGISIYTGPEGGSGTISCYLTLPGNRKFFCKNECKGEDILIQTDDVRANRGRYSIKYKGESSGRGIVSMTIRNLTQSDSGRYSCGLGGSLVPDSVWSFEVRVSDGLLDKNSGFVRTGVEGENVTYPCTDAVNRSRIFFCKGECKKEEDILIETDKNRAQSGRYSIEYKEGSTFGLYVTITQVVKSDSGRYRCGYGRALSPDSSHTFSIIVVDAPTTSKPTWTHRPSSTSVPSASTPPPIISSSGVLLYVGLTLVVVFILSSLAVLIICIKRNPTLCGLRTRGNSDATNMEITLYENFPPVSTHEDSTYQSLSPASMDQNQTYSTLTLTHNTYETL